MATAEEQCKIDAKAARDKRLAELANRFGQAAYDAFVATYNTFIDTLSALADALTAILEPIITLDAFVFDTFVRPPLNAVLSVAKTVQKTVKVPAQIIGATSNKCNGTRQNGVAVRAIESFLVQDLDKLTNQLDSYEYHAVLESTLLKSLQMLPDYVDGLKITQTYAQFIASL